MAISAYSEVYLGVYLTEFDSKTDYDITQPDYGLKVHKVIENSPADEADLQDGDIILELENQKLTTIDQLVDILKKNKIGDSVEIKYFRNNKTFATKLKLANKEKTEISNIEDRIKELLSQSKTFIFRYESQDDNVIGIEISPVNTDSLGVRIAKVLPKSPADKANLQVGDIITNINGAQISKTTEVIDTIQKAEAGTYITLEFLRNNKLNKIQVEVVKRKSIFE